MNVFLRYKNELSAAAIVLFFFFLVIGIISGSSGQLAELKKKENKLSVSKARLEDLQRLDNQLKDIKTSSFLKDLRIVEERARGLGVDIRYLRPTQRERDLYQEVIIDLGVVAGSYKSLVRFMSLIEEDNIIIESLELNERNEAKIMLRGLIAK